jgi:tetraacyldisaccharide 4'-kinase
LTRPRADPAAAAPPAHGLPLAQRLEALLQRHWWRPTPSALSRALRPLSWLYGALAWAHRSAYRYGWKQVQRAPVPVVVVGNLIAGGAGKTPTVIALVQALQAAGRRPGIVSRGYGRQGQAVQGVGPNSSAAEVGDEPLLMHRRTQVPVWVGRARASAARALCAAHPQVDVLVCDDGLQHHALARDAELWVFDDRGAGNGLLLPAGPLRERLPHSLPAGVRLLYTGQRPSTPLPGPVAVQHAAHALPLADWWAGRLGARLPLAALRGRPLLALAGIAAPEKFFAPLRAAGLSLRLLPQPDHARYDTLPWACGNSENAGLEVITTEKDAVKLYPQRLAGASVWVVPLDLELPAELIDQLLANLPAAAPATSRPIHLIPPPDHHADEP